MRPSVLIGGIPLCGFAAAFDQSWGKKPKGPMPRVTPTLIGGVLAPFACPHCGQVRSETVDARKRRLYADRERGFSWCPACRHRYVIDFKGQPLAGSLPAGAVCAPAKVERGGQVSVSDTPEEAGGLDLLGAEMRLLSTPSLVLLGC